MNKILSFFCLFLIAGSAVAAQDKSRPNILAIWGDDIGVANLSAYTHGMMGYRTPNIDRIAKEGGLFTDYYGENSCTAGRSAFVTGQHPIRTGLTKVGMPGADRGLRKEDVTFAAVLKNKGYTTGQFGKNHLGDLDEFLPTNHGFDEFFGNLYHLNAEEEPEREGYPQDPQFKKMFGPRGVIHSTADGKIEDTGPLTKKRMETIDEEVTAHALRFIDNAVKADKPFFVWWNATRMHVFTHLKDESKGLSKRGGIYGDGLLEHDGHVGQLLDKLDDLGIADNTIVLYTTDNGAEVMSWPDGGTTPFYGEKNTTWEGGFRVPAMVRWPGTVKPGSVYNEIVAHNDWFATLTAAAGEKGVKEKLLKGASYNGRNYKVHLDGYDLTDYLSGKAADSPRKNFFYFTDDGDLSAVRWGDYKVMYSIQEAHGMHVWRNPYTKLRAPLFFNIRQDPYERAREESIGYDQWYFENVWVMYKAAAEAQRFLMSFKQFPPRQRPASFNVDQIVEQLMDWSKVQYR